MKIVKRLREIDKSILCFEKELEIEDTFAMRIAKESMMHHKQELIKSLVAETTDFKSKTEAQFYELCLKNGITIIKNETDIVELSNGKRCMYDFYVPELDTYVDIMSEEDLFDRRELIRDDVKFVSPAKVQEFIRGGWVSPLQDVILGYLKTPRIVLKSGLKGHINYTIITEVNDDLIIDLGKAFEISSYIKAQNITNLDELYNYLKTVRPFKLVNKNNNFILGTIKI